ncbi:hypothetical protein PSYAR_02194 [Pseudomonas syringae pv. aceris str. M302273]|nr:hypothetical protein PSYAR_02194 [Pseudomonas syringae pv. aceris str. M302273]
MLSPRITHLFLAFAVHFSGSGRLAVVTSISGPALIQKTWEAGRNETQRYAPLILNGTNEPQY